MVVVKDKISPFFYVKKEQPVSYLFSIEEATSLGGFKTQNSYSQELNIELLSKFKHGSGFVFDCKITNQQYDLDEQLKKQEKLIEQLSTISNELILGVDQRGVISKLNNYDEVKDKWKNLKDKLKNRHQGVLAYGYIDAIDEKIENKQRLVDDIRQYRLLGFLFNGMLKAPFQENQTLSREKIINNVIHCLPITVNEHVYLMEDNENIGELTYGIQGKLEPLSHKIQDRIDKYFKYYGLGRNRIVLSQYNGYYKLDKFTAWVNEALLTLTLTNKRGYERKMKFNLKLK